MPPWHQLPEELFEVIISCLEYHGHVEMDLPSRRARTLGPFSLVSRYWAAKIRPKIFSDIVICSRKGAMGLVSLVKSSRFTPAISSIVISLGINHQVSSGLPWLHLLWNLFGALKFPKLTTIWICGEGEMTMSAVRSPYFQNLPRIIPLVFTSYAHILHRLRLKSFGDLFFLLEHIDTDILSCRSVEWPYQSPNMRLASFPVSHGRHYRRYANKMIRVVNCTAVWPFFCSLVTTREPHEHSPQSPAYIHTDQILAVFRFFKHFTDDCNCISWWHHKHTSIEQSLMKFSGKFTTTNLSHNRLSILCDERPI